MNDRYVDASTSISSWAFDDKPRNTPHEPSFIARLVRRISEHREAEAERRDAPPEVLSRTLHGEHLIQRRLR